MCLVVACRPMPMAPSRRPAWSQVSAAPRRTHRAPHTSTSRTCSHDDTLNVSAISFPGNFLPRQSPSTSISMVPSLALAPAHLGPHGHAHTMPTPCAPCMFMVLLGFYMCSSFLLVSGMPLVLLVLLVRLVSSCQLLCPRPSIARSP
jgi:hypothetical protein